MRVCLCVVLSFLGRRSHLLKWKNTTTNSIKGTSEGNVKTRSSHCVPLCVGGWDYIIHTPPTCPRDLVVQSLGAMIPPLFLSWCPRKCMYLWGPPLGEGDTFNFVIVLERQHFFPGIRLVLVSCKWRELQYSLQSMIVFSNCMGSWVSLPVAGVTWLSRVVWRGNSDYLF
jgi:hypothetical protein